MSLSVTVGVIIVSAGELLYDVEYEVDNYLAARLLLADGLADEDVTIYNFAEEERARVRDFLKRLLGACPALNGREVRAALYRNCDTLGAAIAMTPYGDTALSCPRRDVLADIRAVLLDASGVASVDPLGGCEVVLGDDGLLYFE